MKIYIKSILIIGAIASVCTAAYGMEDNSNVGADEETEKRQHADAIKKEGEEIIRAFVKRVSCFSEDEISEVFQPREMVLFNQSPKHTRAYIPCIIEKMSKNKNEGNQNRKDYSFVFHTKTPPKICASVTFGITFGPNNKNSLHAVKVRAKWLAKS